MSVLSAVKSAAAGAANSAGIPIPGQGPDRAFGKHDSGSLQKMELQFFTKADGGGPVSVNGKSSLKMMLNPSSISMTKKVELEMETSTNAQVQSPKAVTTKPIELKFGDLWFDTFDTRQNVRTEYITTLEGLLDPVESEHVLPVVAPVWGNFNTQPNSPDYYFYVTSLDVVYSMFLPDGTPVRAKVTMTLTQANPKDKKVEFQSPDHAKLYTVVRGDTLQSIATAEYDDPKEWRRIADLNGIADPMSLSPGTKLLVPPILS